MAETGIQYTLTTPGGTITFNTETVVVDIWSGTAYAENAYAGAAYAGGAFITVDPYAGSGYVGAAEAGAAYAGAAFAVTIGGVTNTYVLSEVAGLDMPLIRGSMENLPQRDGVAIGDGYMGARSPSLAGVLLPADASFITRREMEDELRAALLSIVDADGVLEWTPS